MDVFLQNILGMLPVLGIYAFEQSSVPIGKEKGTLLTCKGKGVTATGYDTPQGFVVLAGSLAASTETPSLKHFAYITELRSDLRTSNVLVPDGDNLRFTQDYTFTSPSLASCVVLGRSSNGRLDWRDPSGKTLKQLQEAQSQATSALII